MNPRAGFPTYTLSRGGGFPLFVRFSPIRVSIGVSMQNAQPKPSGLLYPLGKKSYGTFILAQGVELVNFSLFSVRIFGRIVLRPNPNSDDLHSIQDDMKRSQDSKTYPS